MPMEIILFDALVNRAWLSLLKRRYIGFEDRIIASDFVELTCV